MWPMTIIINHPKAILACIYPRRMFLLNIFTCKRQSKIISLMSLSNILGFIRESRNFFKSSLGIFINSLTIAIARYANIKYIPIINGRTKLSYPPTILSIIFPDKFYKLILLGVLCLLLLDKP